MILLCKIFRASHGLLVKSDIIVAYMQQIINGKFTLINCFILLVNNLEYTHQ